MKEYRNDPERKEALLSKKRDYYHENRDQARATMKASYERNREARIAQVRRHQQKLRHEVIEAYGGECTCCGESTFVFLALDHVHNDGAAHRRKVGAGYAMYKWARDNGFPDSLQVMCQNCNWAKHVMGVCPHRAD